MTKSKTKLPVIKKLGLTFIKPLKVTGWLLLGIIGTTLPTNLCQIYENYVYTLPTSAMSKTMISHYANMINYVYQIGAISTVLIGYLAIKKVITELKKPSNLDLYYQQHPDYRPQSKINTIKTKITNAKNKKTNKVNKKK